MEFFGQLNARSKLGMHHGVPARKLSLEADPGHLNGGSETVCIVSLTRNGFLGITKASISLGEKVEVIFPGRRSAHAEAVWVNEDYVAFSFDKIVSNSILRSIAPEPDNIHVQSAMIEFHIAYDEEEETLGTRIKRLRKSRGYTMQHFATRVGVSKPTLWRWEKDEVLPQRKSLAIISAELKITESELLYDIKKHENGIILNSRTHDFNKVDISTNIDEIARSMGVPRDRIKIIIK